MRLKLNNDFKKVSHSSKNALFEDIKEKNDIFSKMNFDRSFAYLTNKNSNNLLNIRSKKIKNTQILHYNPLKKMNNFLHPTYLYKNKQSTNLNKSKLSLADIYNKKTKNTLGDNIVIEHSSNCNLKLVQKELQYKLLDMSIQIENNVNSEDNNDSNSLSYYEKTNNNFWGKSIKNEIESGEKIREDGKRRKSVNVHDCNQLNNLNNAASNKGFQPQNKDYKSNTSINFQNVLSFRNELSNNNINMNKNNRRNSVIIKNNINLNRFNTNNSFISPNKNKSMYIHNNNNITLIKNNQSFIKNNKSMYLSSRNVNVNKMIMNIEYENQYRVIKRNKELYDSYEDEEVIEELEEEYYFISPETHRIFIFDTLLLFCVLFCSIYYPIHIAQSICFCTYIPIWIRVVLFLSDFLNIFDILISFFRAYYNFEFILIKKNEKIVFHYLKKNFLFDIIAALPVFSFSYYLCTKYKPDGKLCFINGVDFKYNTLKIFSGLKIIKIFKVVNKKTNRGINYFYEKISENYTLEKTMKMMLFALMCFIGFNLFICYHIYIGRQTYPNWIVATNNQDKDFLNLYLISFYFLITTITSVGYGDITCVSLGETIFQIILLTIGVIAYSWVVSTIGNYVKKETRAAIKYNKDIGLLEEIRISYPKMSFKLYNKIQKHLETVSHQQERFDTNLLVNNLPYTLKNTLMFIIYEKIIKKFIFFNECENSDFILRILTSYIPMSAKKGAFIIHEGELVDNIIFVKEGRLSLVAAIDLDNPLVSIDKYLGEKFEDINEKMDTNIENSLVNKSMNIGKKIEKATTEIKSFLKTRDELNDTNIGLEIAKRDFDGDDFDLGNHQFLNILDILKNEHYGEVYMFLQKPSPLSLRVKSKYSQLFLLRKNEAMIISKAYPNVWRKIYIKSYHNMKSIKRKTKKIIIHYCQNYGHKYDSSKIIGSTLKDSGNFIVNLGLLNSNKRANNRRIKFDLSNKNVKVQTDKKYPKKKILKHRLEGLNNKIDKNKNIQNIENAPISPISPILNKNNIIGNNGFTFHFSGKQINHENASKSLNQMNKMKTLNYNFRNIHNFRTPPKNKFSNTVSGSSLNKMHNQIKQQSNKFHRISNESLFNNKLHNNILNTVSKISNTNNTNIINNNANNNDDDKTIDLNNSSKDISNFEDKNVNNKNTNLVNDNNILKQMKSNIAVRCNSIRFKNKEKEKIDSNYISSISFKGKYTGPLTVKPLEAMKTLQETNLNDTKIIQSSNKNTVVSQGFRGSREIKEKTPNTIKNLSRPLIKKIQKKIKKRRKKKRLYKMLLSKISESLIRINPNINLNSSINNSFINISQRNDNNFQFGGLQTSLLMQDNSITSERPEINEVINPINGQELLIIPESPEFDSESSSENSKSSNESNTISIEGKKKKMELSISENVNFSFSTTYANLNTISEGNYSKDVNLQKSVMKLIGVYLKEKKKNKNKPSGAKYESTVKKEKLQIQDKDISLNKINKKEKDKSKDKDKDKKNEEDVWAFLNEDDHNENEDLNFNFKSSSSKDNSDFGEKNYSKTPKGKFKKNVGFISKTKSRFKKNNSNIYDGNKKTAIENSSPKTRKKKDNSKKRIKKEEDLLDIKKCSTIVHKKTKKKIIKNNKFKSNKNLEINNNMNKKYNNSNFKDTFLSSLDLSINDNLEIQQGSFIQNYYKTSNNGEESSNSKIDENLSKIKINE